MNTVQSVRLGKQPGERIDRSARLHFSWDGRQLSAFAGDTVASALLASGVRTVSRSFKLHRRRGVLSADLYDPHCNVTVGDVPNVRGAHVRVEDGMVVRSQGGWPSVERDVKVVNGLVAKVLSAGFYYKTFMAPTSLQPVYRSVLRRFSSGGPVPRTARSLGAGKRYVFPDVIVVGAGPSGLGAALGAAGTGARVLLVEQEYELGGSLSYGTRDDLALLDELRGAVTSAETIEVMCNSSLFGCYDDGWVAIRQGALRFGGTDRLLRGRPGALVLAPGLIERPAVFEGNAFPGVMLPTGVRRLINLYAVRPGQRAVVFHPREEGEAAAIDLEHAGAEVVRIEAASGLKVTRGRGHKQLECVEFSDGRQIAADLLVTAAGWSAPVALATMAGAEARLSGSTLRLELSGLPEWALVTGGLIGASDAAGFAEHGKAVGEEAARRSLHPGSANIVVPELPRGLDATLAPPAGGIVDFDEEVEVSDLRLAVGEGYRSIELAKRYTTVTMGMSQGKHSLVNAIAILAEETSQSVGSLGTTTFRPPFTPVSLGTLAGAMHHPVRRTPMHDWHVQHGALFFTEGEWLRPESYGDAQGEAATVRSAVGIIDVSTLGKIELRGRDALAFLDFLYINSWGSLTSGRARYGVMCDESGVVVEDGVVGRLGDRYVLTTTSSGARRTWQRIERLIQEHFAGAELYAALVTDQFASMNVTGPRARELLSGLVTGCSLDPEDFPFMHIRAAQVAGVDDCFIWRIGFTGELSFEVHVPSGCGREVWESLFEAGRDFGIRPFGVEAQRILRIEKGHFVVGQDSDAETTPFELGLGKMVGRKARHFIGQLELEHRRSLEVQRQLIGLQSSEMLLESMPILVQGRLAGRVTSSKWSPTLDCCVALGLLDRADVRDGSHVSVRRADGSSTSAKILAGVCHVDPAGERARA